MNTRTAKFNRPKVLIAILAMAALILTALAVGLVGSAQAQSPDNTPTPTPTPINTYADPQPCGPEPAKTAFMHEPHEIITGHFALFDSYWENTTDPESTKGNTGILRTNECPPKVVTTDDGRGGVPVTSLTDSNIDIDEAIFHVKDVHETTIVDDAVGDTDGLKLRLDQYPEVGEYADVGDNVWWLRLDDPNTDADEQSNLTLGFSTARFDSKYWAGEDDQPAFRYMFEVERNPGIEPDEHPHLLAYKAYKQRGQDEGDQVTVAELVWDSAEVHTEPLPMEPGELEDLQWVFTKPGTYVISVHLIGWVRKSNTDVANWKAISDEVTETSEVNQYTIQVGDKLDEVEPPQFGVSYVVHEDSAAGTKVGTPIKVFYEGVHDLEYRLSGAGSNHFALVSTSDPNQVQIVVGDSVNLDHRRQASYDLTLGVTDSLDHESNPDPTLDHTISVEIEVAYPRVTIEVDNPNPSVGDTVIYTARLHDVGPTESVTYAFTFPDIIYSGHLNSHSRRHTSPTTETVQLDVFYRPEGALDPRQAIEISAEPVTVTWSRP